MTIRILLLSAITLILSCCSGKQHDHRLSRIEDIIAISPKEALDSLGTIDYARLSDADKHYYDFLSIKASDKAYITHTSDSLILKVIDYAQSHQDEGRYPEALYYGGRVYRDIGDYPTALRYFQYALDMLPSDTENQTLRGNALSQTGQLLNQLRLYDQADSYIKNVLAIDLNNQDTINLVYDLQLLGAINLHSRNFNDAERFIKKSLEYSSNLPKSYQARAMMYLAAIKYEIDKVDSALNLIRHTPDMVKQISRNVALAYASEIYLKSGIRDTAYMYAHELINSTDFTNRKTGYQILLSPELRGMIKADTINQYITDYQKVLEAYFNENEYHLAIIQHSFYNYQLHERVRAKTEAIKTRLQYCIIGILFVVMLMGLSILYLKNRNKNNLIALHIALENVNRLKQALNEQENKPTKEIIITPNSNNTAQELCERLRKEIFSISQNNDRQTTISPIILRSEAYLSLQYFIKQGKILPESNRLWDDLEKTVIESSPNFKTSLHLLTGGKLTTHDLHTSILIKCGVTPSQMTTLLGRTKGTIVSRRESLCFKIFGVNLGTKTIDHVIRLL